MAGEILTGGLSDTFGTVVDFNFSQSLTSKAVIYSVGSVSIGVELEFFVGLSNKMKVWVYKRLYGQSTYQMVLDHLMDSTSGSSVEFTYNFTALASYIIILEPIYFGVVQQVICNGGVSNYINYSEMYNTGKLLRICNNPQTVQVGFYEVNVPNDTIVTDAVNAGRVVTTSVGTLLQNGQWIFGQN